MELVIKRMALLGCFKYASLALRLKNQDFIKGKSHMAELYFDDILINVETDVFNRIIGYAEFPYFHKQIQVTCDKDITPEYVIQSLQWLAAVDETQIREICQYALYYLQDQLASTSVGELLDEDIQHIQEPLEVLRYMELCNLDIKPPLNPDIPVLNLSGGCDWQEDEGLQCLMKNHHVIYLGHWNDMNVWNEHLLDDNQYLANYVLYPQREVLRQKAAERLKQRPPNQIPHLEFAMGAPIRHFVEFLLAGAEHCTREEAWVKLEGTRLMAILQEDRSLAWESASLLYHCYCMERDQGAVDMEVYLWEETHSDK